jgi:hypothetical protein
MPIFQPPIPRENYCRKHGSSYSGNICPECAADREREAKNRVCPYCQQPRIVNTNCMYCNNIKCNHYFIMYSKEELVFKYNTPQQNTKTEDAQISEHNVLRCRICGRITLVQERKDWYVCICCKAWGITPESVK